MQIALLSQIPTTDDNRENTNPEDNNENCIYNINLDYDIDNHNMNNDDYIFNTIDARATSQRIP